MKLLFDQNLSPNLVIRLADLFPDSLHVRDVGLEAAEDQAAWDYAKANELVIVSKDGDMHQRKFPVWCAAESGSPLLNRSSQFPLSSTRNRD